MIHYTIRKFSVGNKDGGASTDKNLSPAIIFNIFPQYGMFPAATLFGTSM